jgi:hypothetical protein
MSALAEGHFSASGSVRFGFREGVTGTRLRGNLESAGVGTEAVMLTVNASIEQSHAAKADNKNKQTQWSEFVSELYRPIDRQLSAKLV